MFDEYEYSYYYGSKDFEKLEILYEIDDQFYKGLKRVKNMKV